MSKTKLTEVQFLGLPRKEVVSSNIFAVGYYSPEKALIVEFARSAGVYLYKPVTEQQYLEFLSAESLGKYFAANIKTNKDIKFTKLQ